MGDVRQAIRDFGSATRIEPRDPQPWLNRAKAWAALGRDDEARKDYAKAAELGAQIPTLAGPPAGETVEGTVYTVVRDVNFRAGPSIRSTRSGVLRAGEKVLVVGETGGWYEVVINRGHYFVYSDFLARP
jgi:tetratricopeptide (TPR) repeat protein